MIFQNEQTSGVVASSGMGETTAAQIETTAHMFGILSSRLYSDKIGAVLREPGCNALDAHTAVDTPDLPIEVKVPNRNDPTFYIKDWGPGLDEAEVRYLYLTYGKSTKQNSNKMIGALGLGSKSPFAYTHTFTIVAVKGGVQRFFSVYLNEEGIPVVTKTQENPAPEDWTSGLMVTFPVEPGDFVEFKEKARHIYSWFAVQPRILGMGMGEGPVVNTFAWTSEDKLAAVGPSVYGFMSPAVVMGNIRYPIDPQQLLSKADAKDREILAILLGVSVHLYMPIGSVLFTPSREQLDYTSFTRKSLLEALLRTAKQLGASVRKAVERKPGEMLFQYLCRFNTVRAGLQAFNIKTEKELKALLQFSGASATELASVPNPASPAMLVAPASVSPRYDGGLAGPQLMRIRLFRLEEKKKGEPVVRTYSVHAGKANATRSVDEHGFPLAIEASEKSVGFIVDSSKNTLKMLKTLALEGEYSTVVVFERLSRTPVPDLIAFANQMVDADHLGGLPLRKVSELQVSEERMIAANIRVRRGRLTEEERRERAVVHLLDAGNGETTKTTLADVIDTDATHFVVLGETMRTKRRERYRTTVSNMGCQALTLDNLCAAYPRFVHLAGLVGMDLNDVILVSQATATKFNLVDLGFTPLLPDLQGLLCGEQSRDILRQAYMDTMELPALTASVSSDTVFSFLNSVKTNNQPLWDLFSSRYGTSQLAKDVEYLYQYRATTPTFTAMSHLVNKMSFYPMVKEFLEFPKTAEYTRIAKSIEKMADFRIFNSHHLKTMAVENPETAMAHLELFMLLKGVMPTNPLTKPTRKPAAATT